ncbi:hypothetical protein H0H93_013520 [Arthromyces matolae]|nr:hypothetical protein H0H93_013520 [Arthromyces matolae]
MRIPSSSSFVLAAALVASSSTPSLAAPTPAASEGGISHSGSNQLIASRSGTIIPRADDQETALDNSTGQASESGVVYICQPVKDAPANSVKDKTPVHSRADDQDVEEADLSPPSTKHDVLLCKPQSPDSPHSKSSNPPARRDGLLPNTPTNTPNVAAPGILAQTLDEAKKAVEQFVQEITSSTGGLSAAKEATSSLPVPVPPVLAAAGVPSLPNGLPVGSTSPGAAPKTPSLPGGLPSPGAAPGAPSLPDAGSVVPGGGPRAGAAPAAPPSLPGGAQASLPVGAAQPPGAAPAAPPSLPGGAQASLPVGAAQPPGAAPGAPSSLPGGVQAPLPGAPSHDLPGPH